MRILRLEAENFKKLVAIDITPTGDIIHITGKNGAGKSSVLDCIVALLCGEKAIEAVPVRKGQKKGKIKAELGTIDMGEYTVTRSFTEGNTYLKIETKEGHAVKTPQKFLDQLVGKISFDPLAFINDQDAKQQRNTLLQLINISVDDLDQEEKRLRKEREEVGRELKKQEGLVQGLSSHPNITETEEISMADLSKQYNEAVWKNAKLNSRAGELAHIKSIAMGDIERVKELRKMAQQYTDDADALEETLVKRKVQYTEMKAELDKEKVIDIGDLTTQMQSAEVKNIKIRQNKAMSVALDALDKVRTDYEGFTASINKVIEQRQKVLESTPMPIPGLTFDDNELIYNGIPLIQCSDGEKLMVSMAISMALNPTLRVLRIKDGSLLDAGNRQILKKMIKDQDYQLWFESVDDAGKVGIYIEEGHVTAVKGVPVE